MGGSNMLTAIYLDEQRHIEVTVEWLSSTRNSKPTSNLEIETTVDEMALCS